MPLGQLPPLPSLGSAARAPGLAQSQEDEKLSFTPEEERSLISSAGGGAVSGLSAVGNLLGLPVSMVLDVATLKNPFDQLLTPFSDKNRTYGRDFLRHYGLVGKEDKWGNFASGMAMELVADPLTYMTLGAAAVGKAGKILQKSGGMKDLTAMAVKQGIGKREARLTKTIRDVIDAAPQSRKDSLVKNLKTAAETDKGIVRGPGHITNLDAIMDEKLGALGGFGLPGAAPKVLFGRGTGLSLKMAKKMDKCGRAERYSTPMRYAAAQFSRPLKGTVTDFLQGRAPIAHEAERKAVETAREKVGEIIDNFESDGIFDPRRAKPEDAMNNSNAIFKFMEESGDDWTVLPNHLEKYRLGLNEMKLSMSDLLVAYKKAGLNAVDLDDMMIRYNPRLRHRFPTGTKGFTTAEKVFDPSDPFTKQRRAELKEWHGGTGFLNKLSVDPNVSAKAWNMGYTDNIVPDDVLDRKARYVLGQYGSDVLGPGHEEALYKYLNKMLKPAEEKALVNKVKKVTSFMMRLDPRHVAEKVPLFRVNPAEAWLARLEHGYRAVAAADEVTNTLAEFLKTTPAKVPGDWSAGKALQQFKLTGGEEGIIAKRVLIGKLNKNKKLLDELGVSEITDEILDERLFITPDIVEDMGRYMGSFTNPKSVAGMLKAYDIFTNVFKTGVTAFPAFHIRNFYSGAYNNFVIGAYDPNYAAYNPMRYIQPYVDSWKALNKKTIAGANKIPGFEHMTAEEATQELRMEVFSQKVIGKGMGPGGTDILGFADPDLASQIPGATPMRTPPPAGTTRLERSTNVWKTAGFGQTTEDVFTPARYHRDASRLVEGLNRMSPYIALRKQGFLPDEAARKGRGAQVSYDELTGFERGVMRRAIPFYSFTRGMIPWTIEELIHKPGGKLAVAIKTTTRAKGDEETQAVIPDYISQTISMPIGRQPDGSDRYFTGMGLMFEDPTAYAGLLTGDVQGTLLEIASRMHPIPKGVAEWATGQSFFQRGPLGGRPIEDLDPSIGRIAANLMGKEDAYKTSPAFEHVLANSPISRYITTARTLTDTRKGALVKFLNTMTGLRISDVSPAAQDAILRERAYPLMKKLGARTFRKVYFSKEELAKMPPDKQLEALKLHALMSQLADRAKSRKAERVGAEEPEVAPSTFSLPSLPPLSAVA